MGDDEYYDTSVMAYCSELTAQNYSDENYEIRKRETYEKIAEQLKFSGYKNKEEKKRRINFKNIAAVFIVLILAWGSMEAISTTAFHHNLFDTTIYLSKTIWNTIRGNEIQQDNINRTGSASIEYETIEDFEKEENIDLMIPTWLPEDIEIEKIVYSYEFEEKQVNLYYNDKISSLMIRLDSAVSNADGATIIENNNIKFYVFTDSNIIWWQYEGNLYNFACGFDIKEITDKVIENIK
jgi:hypothetical protein